MRAAECLSGMGVVYRPTPTAQGEDGEVVRVNDAGDLVFVRYADGVKATRPGDLSPAPWSDEDGST